MRSVSTVRVPDRKRPMHNLFDSTFNGLPETYRAEMTPDLYPHARPMRLENWSQDDLEAYVGGIFTPGYGRRAA